MLLSTSVFTGLQIFGENLVFTSVGSGYGGYREMEREGLWSCALDSCGWWSDTKVGFANAVKKLHLVQQGDKAFRYFRMTQICQDIN